MIRNVIQQYFTDVKKILNEYGIVSDLKYSSDVSLISEYTKSYRFRTLYGDSNSIISDVDKTLINSNPNFALLMYNRGPIKKHDDFGNNISMSFEGWEQDNTTKWLTLENPNVSIPNIQLRNVMVGRIDLTCKFLTSNSNTLEMLEFLMEHSFFRMNNTINVHMDLGDGIEPFEMEYNTIHEGIDEFGFIDNKLYGDIQQLSFTVTIYGLFFSMFKQNVSSNSELTFDYEFVPPDNFLN